MSGSRVQVKLFLLIPVFLGSCAKPISPGLSSNTGYDVKGREFEGSQYPLFEWERGLDIGKRDLERDEDSLRDISEDLRNEVSKGDRERKADNLVDSEWKIRPFLEVSPPKKGSQIPPATPPPPPSSLPVPLGPFPSPTLQPLLTPPQTGLPPPSGTMGGEGVQLYKGSEKEGLILDKGHDAISQVDKLHSSHTHHDSLQEDTRVGEASTIHVGAVLAGGTLALSSEEESNEEHEREVGLFGKGSTQVSGPVSNESSEESREDRIESKAQRGSDRTLGIRRNNSEQQKVSSPNQNIQIKGIGKRNKRTIIMPHLPPIFGTYEYYYHDPSEYYYDYY